MEEAARVEGGDGQGTNWQLQHLANAARRSTYMLHSLGTSPVLSGSVWQCQHYAGLCHIAREECAWKKQ